jgi:excisionase family DNA binding protein
MSDAKTLEWVTVPEAARRLKVTDRTIYRRIKAEKLENREVDGRLEVALEVSDTVATSPPNVATPPSDTVATESDAVRIAVLEARLEEKDKLIDVLTHQNEKLNAELMTALNKLPALEAGSDPEADPEPEEPPRRWWQFWRP